MPKDILFLILCFIKDKKQLKNSYHNEKARL